MAPSDGYVLIALFVIPIATSALLMFVPSKERGAVIGITGLVSLVLLALSIYAFARFDFHGSQFQGVVAYDWVANVGLLGDHGIQLKVGLDGMAATLVLLTGIITLAGTWVSWKLQHRMKDYFILLYLVAGGVYGTWVLLDVFFFFLLYETAVMPMYLLIGVWGSTRKEYGATKLMMMLVAASILIFIGIFGAFSAAGLGTFDMERLFAAGASGAIPRSTQILLFPMVAIGCGTLGGMWPFHSWSPDGHASAPTSVSMLHAGVLMKSGAWGVIRLGFQMLPQGAEYWAPALMLVGITAALYGAISALRQTDLKLMTGFSSVSHMGYVFLGLGTLNVIGMSGAVLQMFAHGVMTALFFLLIGGMYDQSHDREIPNFSGMAKQMPIWTVFFVIAGLASLGLPGMSGFIAEVHIFIGAFRAYPVVGGLAVLTAAITATYLLRMFSQAFFGEFNPRWSALREINFRERAGATVLAITILTMGIWPAPWIDRVSTAIASSIPGVSL